MRLERIQPSQPDFCWKTLPSSKATTSLQVTTTLVVEKNACFFEQSLFLQSALCWECNTSIQLHGLQIGISLWPIKAYETNILPILFAISLAQCITFSLVNCCSVRFELTCLKTPGNFLNFQTEIGLVGQQMLSFKDGPFYQKNVVLYHHHVETWQ